MRKSIVVAAIGLGILSLAGPVHGAEEGSAIEDSSYTMVGSEAPVPAVLADAPVVAATPTAQVAGATGQVAAAGDLPTTGSDTSSMMQMGAAALLTGGGLVLVSQKRNRKARQTN